MRNLYYCIQNGKSLDKLSLEEYQKIDPIFDNTIYEAIDLHNCVSQRNIVGGPAKATVERAIAINKGLLTKL